MGVPITTDASVAKESAEAVPILRLCRVHLRPRRQARAASSAYCLFGAPPAWATP